MLVICSHCRRHVRHTESNCPFCSHSLPQHANRYGVGLALALTVASAFGCDDDNGGAVAVYAGPPAGGTTAQGGASSLGGSSAQGGTTPAKTTGGASSVTPSAATGGGWVTLYGGPPAPGANS